MGNTEGQLWLDLGEFVDGAESKWEGGALQLYRTNSGTPGSGVS